MVGPRRLFLSGRAILGVVTVAMLLGWGVMTVVHSGRVFDVSGRNLDEVRALVAELSPGTHVTFVGDAPLARLLMPLVKGSNRLAVTRRSPAGPELSDGAVQVRSGTTWMVLDRPDLQTLLWALALVSSPYAPTPLKTPPTERLPEHSGVASGGVISHAQTVAWSVSGVLLPTLLCLMGLWWRRTRTGR